MLRLRKKAQKLIPKPNGVSERKYRRGEGRTEDIIEVIMYADKLSGSSTKKFATVFKGLPVRKSLKQLWGFVRTEIRYVADEDGHERVKSPSKTWGDRFGDCKSMSIFIASVLQNMDIPYSYRFVSWAENENITHVYIVAHTKEGDIILDAVYDRFDSEEPYAYKKDIRGMTQISYVHGIGKAIPVGGARTTASVLQKPEDVFRLDDSPRQAPPPRFYNPEALTKGEFELMLLDRELEVLQYFYGDQEGHYTKARNLIYNQFKAGVHRTPFPSGAIPTSLYDVARQIRLAKTKSGSAVKNVTRSNSFAAVGNLIQRENCDKKYGSLIIDPVTRRPRVHPVTKELIYSISPEDQEAHDLCVNLQIWRDFLNANYEKSAHHLLYEFIENPNQETNTVSSKTLDHKLALSDLAQTTGIDRDLFVKWTRVGIRAHNATEKKLGPLTPQESIQILRDAAALQNTNGLPRVGVEPVSTTALVIKLVTVLISAAATVAGGVLAYKSLKLQRDIKGFGTREFSADWPDFNNNPGGSGVPGEEEETGLFTASMLPLLLVGGGAFLIMNDKK